MNGYIAQRRGRYYVVIYEGRDPVTGKEQRRWHPAGTDRTEAELLAKRLAATETRGVDAVRSLTFGAYLTSQWLPAKTRSSRGIILGARHRSRWRRQARPTRPDRAGSHPGVVSGA